MRDDELDVDALQRALDASFGAGPDPEHAGGPLDDVLRGGRRSARRARAVQGLAAALAAVVVVGGAGLALSVSGGHGGPTATYHQGPAKQRVDRSAVAPRPCSASSSDGHLPTHALPEVAGHAVDGYQSFLADDPGNLAQLLDDGRVFLRPGVTMVSVVQDPIVYEPGQRTLGLVVTYQGRTFWVFLETLGYATPGGYDATTAHALHQNGITSIEQWILDYHHDDLPTGDAAVGSRGQALVSLTSSGEVAPAPGVSVLEACSLRTSAAGSHHVAIEVAYAHLTRWVALVRDADGTVHTASTWASGRAEPGALSGWASGVRPREYRPHLGSPR